jgi:hypothetical protein
MHFSRSPFIACAVNATTAWRSLVVFSFSRIAAVASSPSISGICIHQHEMKTLLL